MPSPRAGRNALLSGVPLLLMATIGSSGCSKSEERTSTMTDVGEESPGKGGGQRGGGGGAAFSSFQSRITDRDGARPSAPPPAGDQMAVLPSTPSSVAMPAPMTTVNTTQQPSRASAGSTMVSSAPVSTFSVDVDTASYATMRKAVLANMRPDPSAVRVEEMVNYFRYAMPAPARRDAPFSIATDVVRSPWDEGAGSLIVRVGLRGYDLPAAARKPANLVFLIDVSGSMDAEDRLGLIKRSMSSLADEIRPQDRVSIVAYADSANVVLTPTSSPARIREALSQLQTGGSTAGGAGLTRAYEMARQAKIPGGINRVLIASDGDFNVGESDTGSLKALVTRERQDGITLTTLGVGHGADYRDAVMETLADAGDGNAAYLDDDLEARKVLHDELTSTLQVIAKDVKAQVEFNPAVVQSYRLIGYENRRLAERDFDDDAIDAGDIGAGHQVTALYEIRPVMGDVATRRRYAANKVAAGIDPTVVAAQASDEAMFVKLRYKLPDGGASRLIQQSIPAGAIANAGIATGDTAFALAVSAFGQKLAGVPELQNFGTDRIISLAGQQTDPQRTEFIDLVRRADMSYPPIDRTSPTAAPATSQGLNEYPAQEKIVQPSTSWKITATLLFLLALGTGGLLLWMRRRDPALMLDDTMRIVPPVSESKTGSQLASSLRLARTESTDPETERTLSHLSHVGERARIAAGADPDIDVEVQAILDRHLPGYVDEYVQARRRAAPDRATELEAGLRRTLDMMIARLRGLLDSQSRRDVDRMNDHGRFLGDRHMPTERHDT